MASSEWWVSTSEGKVYAATLESIGEWLLESRIDRTQKVKEAEGDWTEARLVPQLRDVIDLLEKQDGERESNFFLTTETTLPDYEIARRIEVITSECAFGMNLFKDFFTGLSDVFGGRSGTTQNVLRDARKKCLWELRQQALEIHADAVIGIDLDYSEFSGGGKSMLFLVASGTAVKLKKS